MTTRIDLPDGCDSELELAINIESFVSTTLAETLATIEELYERLRDNIREQIAEAEPHDVESVTRGVSELFVLGDRRNQACRVALTQAALAYEALYGDEEAVHRGMELLLAEWPDAEWSSVRETPDDDVEPYELTDEEALRMLSLADGDLI